MPVILPFQPSVPAYRVGTTLDGVAYLFDVRWNARDAAWYMNVLDAEQSQIRSGIKIVLGALLGRRCVDARFPPGVMLAVDTSRKGADAGIDDLGARVLVYYFTIAEWRALAGA